MTGDPAPPRRHCRCRQLSLRRLNLHLLPVISSKGGVVIVDSTRRGRYLPDSFKKTIPIWAACVNRAVARHRLANPTSDPSATGPAPVPPDSIGSAPPPPHAQPQDASAAAPWCTQLRCPRSVSPSEHAQITALLDTFVEALCASGADVAAYSALLHKPLRPLWITPQVREVGGHTHTHTHTHSCSRRYPRPSPPVFSVCPCAPAQTCGPCDTCRVYWLLLLIPTW